MSPCLMFSVRGTPRAQPRARGQRRRVGIIDPRIRLWRQAVTCAACDCLDASVDERGVPEWLYGAVEVEMQFRFPTRHRERWGKPHTHRIDVDNLVKLGADSMQDAGLLPLGDQKAAVMNGIKLWCPEGQQGVTVWIRPAQAIGLRTDPPSPEWLKGALE